MDHSYRPQRIHAHASRADGPSGPLRSEQHPLIASSRPYAQPSRTSSPPSAPAPSGVPTPRHASSNPSSQSYLSPSPSPPSYWSSNTSSYSYYTANPSPLSNFSTSTSSTQSSNMSFSYSVTSINSHKSRKNILYPRRAHLPPPPLPLAVPVPAMLSHDVRIWFLCTSLLPNTETRLVPAGKVLLKSFGLLGKFSQLVPVQTDEATHCCSELFITLCHEVHFKRAVRAEELEVPCKLLHTTFKDILHKSGTLSSSKTPKWPTNGALTLQRLSNVSIALFSVLGVFEKALSTINPTIGGRHGDHYRMTLLGLSTLTGLTMETYRTKLNEYLAQTQARLNSLGQFEGLQPPSTSLIFMIPQESYTIEKGSEAEGEGSTANGYTLSYGDSGKNSLPRGILRRLILSSVGRKDM